jgi:hypothetical protein
VTLFICHFLLFVEFFDFEFGERTALGGGLVC